MSNVNCGVPSVLHESLSGLKFQVLSDSVKKRDYDDQLRKEESKSVSHKSHNTPHQVFYYMSFSRRNGFVAHKKYRQKVKELIVPP